MHVFLCRAGEAPVMALALCFRVVVSQMSHPGASSLLRREIPPNFRIVSQVGFPLLLGNFSPPPYRSFPEFMELNSLRSRKRKIILDSSFVSKYPIGKASWCPCCTSRLQNPSVIAIVPIHRAHMSQGPLQLSGRCTTPDEPPPLKINPHCLQFGVWCFTAMNSVTICPVFFFSRP